MSTSGQSAVVIGATGQAGQHLLKELLSSPHFTRVGEYGRRVTSADDIKSGADKLEQKAIDFEKLDESGLKNGKWDVVYITLGTTKEAAGSVAAFEKIDREYVVNAARAAKSDDPSHPQRLVYLSSVGANPKSRILYGRSKGLTEEALASLGYSDTIVFRPALLTGTARPQPRTSEKVASLVTGLLSRVSPSFEVKVATLGKSIALAGKLGSSALPTAARASKVGKEGATFTLIENAGAIGLAKTEA